MNFIIDYEGALFSLFPFRDQMNFKYECSLSQVQLSNTFMSKMWKRGKTEFLKPKLLEIKKKGLLCYIHLLFICL